jgi:hypothetical protein
VDTGDRCEFFYPGVIIFRMAFLASYSFILLRASNQPLMCQLLDRRIRVAAVALGAAQARPTKTERLTAVIEEIAPLVALKTVRILGLRSFLGEHRGCESSTQEDHPNQNCYEHPWKRPIAEHSAPPWVLTDLMMV